LAFFFMAQFLSRQRIAHFVRQNPLLIKVAYYTYRFIQPKFTIGVVGIVWNTHHEVLLVEHIFHPKLPWGLPGGWVGWNEDPAVAVVRELHEELGLVCTIQATIHLEKTQYHHMDMAFLCIASNDIQTVSNELLGYRWFRVDELPHMHKFHYDAIQKAYAQVTNKPTSERQP
jgi:ADP-ribose pyrophosphatase YjhB (NUDIX family)